MKGGRESDSEEGVAQVPDESKPPLTFPFPHFSSIFSLRRPLSYARGRHLGPKPIKGR